MSARFTRTTKRSCGKDASQQEKGLHAGHDPSSTDDLDMECERVEIETQTTFSTDDNNCDRINCMFVVLHSDDTGNVRVGTQTRIATRDVEIQTNLYTEYRDR